MASKQKKGLRGSISDVFGDLLGDDSDDDLQVKTRTPSGGLSRPAGVLQTQSGKRNLLDDDFFSKLAEEAEKDDEASDVSTADPKALLESMKDMDDMDADLFGSKRKPSSAPAQNRTSRTETSKPGDKNKATTQAGGMEKEEEEVKKPSLAPAAAQRSIRKFSFMDEDDDDDHELPAGKQDDDPLDDLLNELDEEHPKSAPSGKAGKQQAVQKKEEHATPTATPTVAPTAASKKRTELTFDDDEDDLMDALGFSDAPIGKGGGLIPKKENECSETPQRARTRLDEILGIGTPPRLLERPVTVEKKDPTLAETQPQKSSGKDSLFGDEDLTFGSYQPTLGSTPEGRTSRRHSVRFSTEDVSSSSPERKPTSSTMTSTTTFNPAWPPRFRLARVKAGRRRSGKGKAVNYKEGIHRNFRETKTTTFSITCRRKTLQRDLETREELKAVPDSPEPSTTTTTTTTAAKLVSKKLEDEGKDDWLSGALSKKKALAQEREKRQEESPGLKRRWTSTRSSGRDSRLRKESPVKRNTTSTPRRANEDKPLPQKQPSNESVVVSSQQQSPTPSPTPSTGAQHTHEREQKPVVVSTSPVQQVSLSNGLEQLFQQQAQLWGLGAPMDQSSLQKTRRDTEHHTGDMSALQSRIVQLEGQVRSLQLEKDQLQMLLDNVQERHKRDTELMENTHRTRVKLLEECASQREARVHTENQELTERLEVVLKQVQQEREELQEQHQRRLAQSQQERDREVERLRELQRKSIQEMKKDHEEQIQRLRRLKEEEIDAVTSATSQTRSLTVVIEQMEQFSLRLDDLSSRIESTHENTTQGLELGARQRNEQLRVLQERLTQQQRDMVEERTRLKEVIAKMDTQLAEQQRQLQQERWRVTAEQAKAESALRGLEEERRTMTQQITIEREELERAKSALLDEQQQVMQRCTEERRKLAAEWTHFHAQDKQRRERELDREGHIISMAQEQADLKLRAGELKQKEEALQRERENLEKLRAELEVEKERMNAAALHLKHRAQEVESLSKLACERYEEGERALQDARRVEAGHQARLRNIRTELEHLRTQEHNLQQERRKVTDYHREMDRIRPSLPLTTYLPLGNLFWFSPAFNSTAILHPGPQMNISRSVSPKLQATLAVLRHTAEKDRDFLQDEQIFLDTLKGTQRNSTLHT
ncbi:LOW QUALITY PROTEIN: fas-binding factor 1 homolog [Silurus meridionalis]|uniref:LOW QUALITY PROTEIN: fas-binding factor 1 homolog n=1 Tax=Silurus meridionalis TaxID=175797 RepID=UPI001EEA5444|nr:LOW QUALITY PROTEIN: fas-binding factor 1 homolog [Silurus meridionalis]